MKVIHTKVDKPTIDKAKLKDANSVSELRAVVVELVAVVEYLKGRVG